MKYRFYLVEQLTNGGGGILKSLDLLNVGHQVPHDRDQASIHVAAHPYGFGSLLNVLEEVVSVGIKSCSSDFVAISTARGNDKSITNLYNKSIEGNPWIICISQI